MISRNDPAWAWMIGAFAGGLAVAVAVLAGRGTGLDGLGLAIFLTARWAFLFFWLSYVGGPMAVLFGPAFAGLARQTRSLGLAFAAALQVHIGLVVWLGVVTRRVPLQGWVLWFFLIALFFADVLVMLSFGIGVRRLKRLWRPLLLLGTTYILGAFGLDFVLGVMSPKVRQPLYAAEYVPFALMILIAIPLRLAALLRQRFGSHSATAFPPRQTVS
jgi:hypothetical protein